MSHMTIRSKIVVYSSVQCQYVCWYYTVSVFHYKKYLFDIDTGINKHLHINASVFLSSNTFRYTAVPPVHASWIYYCVPSITCQASQVSVCNFALYGFFSADYYKISTVLSSELESCIALYM